MTYRILTVPDPRLRIKASPIECVNDNVRKIMDKMLDTMYKEEGCGLAATQVGIHKRIIVMDVSHKCPDLPVFKMANPELLWKSEEQSVYEEGCLSVPGQYADVKRSSRVLLKYIDEHNQLHEREIDGFLATCVQHEIDHLNGKVFIDYLPNFKKDLIIRKVQRELRKEERS
jgi:peptide deformylase